MKYAWVMLVVAAAVAEPRSWSRLDGSPVTGELVAVNLVERTVTIKTSTMVGILPIDAFSEADKAYIAEHLKQTAATIYQPPKVQKEPESPKLHLTCRECGTKTVLWPDNMSHRSCESATHGIGWTLGNVVIQENGNLRAEQSHARCEGCREKLAMSVQARIETQKAASKPMAKKPKRMIRRPQAVREDWRTFPEGVR